MTDHPHLCTCDPCWTAFLHRRATRKQHGAWAYWDPDSTYHRPQHRSKRS